MIHNKRGDRSLIGIIVVSHGSLALELVSISERILGKQDYLSSVSVQVGESEQILYNKLKEIIEIMNTDDVIILSDIFGGSIANTCLYFAKLRGHASVITGVNLPMLIKALTHRDENDLNELSTLACDGGKNGIVDACKILEEKDQDG